MGFKFFKLTSKLKIPTKPVHKNTNIIRNEFDP